jgi:hypothetical protein
MSMAAMPNASLRKKLRHVGEGLPVRRTMYFATVAWLTFIGTGRNYKRKQRQATRGSDERITRSMLDAPKGLDPRRQRLSTSGAR